MPTIQQDTGPPVLISNQEVLELLETRMKERSKKRKRPSTKMNHCEWIEEKVVHHLQSTPCVRLNSRRRDELRSTLQSSKKATTGFALTDAESLQLVNSMPTEPVELHLLIEDLHARMTDRQQKELLQFVASFCEDTPPNFSEGKNDAMDATTEGALDAVTSSRIKEDFTI